MGNRIEVMRVLHVGFGRDRMRRSPEDLLRAWPTFTHAAEAARTAGVEVVVLQAAHHDAILVQNAVSCHFVKGWKQLTRRAVELNPSVVQVRGLSFPVQTYRLSRMLPRVPVLVQDHADKVPAWWKRPVHRWGHQVVTGMLCAAPERMQPFVKAGILQQNARSFEAWSGSTAFTPGDLHQARRATGLSGDPCLIWIGRLNDNKDPLTVLEAVARASLALPALQLWCCYTAAPLLHAVRQRIDEDPRLKGRVHLLGAVPHDEIEPLLRASDMFVLGSHSEGSSFAVAEALACGVTPLITDVPASRAMTANGAVGALFPPGDAASLARLIIGFAARDRAQLRQNARAHFERLLSFEALGRKLKSAYESALAMQ